MHAQIDIFMGLGAACGHDRSLSAVSSSGEIGDWVGGLRSRPLRFEKLAHEVGDERIEQVAHVAEVMVNRPSRRSRSSAARLSRRLLTWCWRRLRPAAPKQYWQYQTDATPMYVAQGGIVTVLKTRTLSVTATCFQYHGSGRRPGLKIRSSQEGVGSSPTFGSIYLGQIATCRFAPSGNKLGTALR